MDVSMLVDQEKLIYISSEQMQDEFANLAGTIDGGDR